MERNEYNGWTNYATWLTHLWIDNDTALYTSLRDLMETYVDNARSLRVRDARDKALRQSAELLEDWFTNEAGVLTEERPGLFTDILNAHARKVDWDEIAEHMLADIWLDEVRED